MGLRDTFKTAAVAAQDAFGDVFVSVRYEQHASIVYDVSSGVASAVTSTIGASFVLQDYSQREIDNENVFPTDVKALVAQDRFAGTPTMEDTVVIAATSAEYEVVRVMKDPADALWEMQLRRK